MTTRKRALVAMSGGVDSSVAAALMMEAGYEVIGATMRVFDYSDHSHCGSCCSPDDVHDAKRVADKLGIAHYTFNVEEKFRERVIDNFVAEYLQGRTPIPCVQCNDRVKFDWLFRRMQELGCEVLVTGHYARVERDGGRARLLCGVDPAKDQSYFLFRMTQEQLARVDFPIGAMHKPQVREIAARYGLAVAEKPDSQELCFVPGNDYARVVEKIAGSDSVQPGEIVDRAGNVLGRHDGYHRFTVGQRKGLGRLGDEPHYVVRIEPETARVVVGKAGEVFSTGLVCTSFNWIDGEGPNEETRGRVRVRHGHRGVDASLYPFGDGVSVRFDEPVRAVTPGQAAVFYDGDRVLGGGFIDQAVAEEGAMAREAAS
ncbi:MAG: tRNA 2-thiouridine(34) synthase MnmA [Deltaproteobacteria bacterium]|nr:tRNA 2-thiouridine(34) synthase MnmA [Deltaproteobacteria bacterium]MCB9479555.1 tRNA 2-thiouridine(34) synthase MnmA [Deltaproteobacteria bacterium]